MTPSQGIKFTHATSCGQKIGEKNTKKKKKSFKKIKINETVHLTTDFSMICISLSQLILLSIVLII